MAHPVKDSFLDLERHRQLLEENIAKLQKSLKHWRTWEAEYQGLKEEILAITPSPSRDQLIAIGRDYESELLKKTELEDILGVKIPRSADQVTNILQRRVDYVSQNVHTLEKQLEIAENKITAASIVSAPDVMNEEGLPLTEIFEELDEEGNVISSHISTPGSSKRQLLEVLQKAGITELPPGVGNEPLALPTRSTPVHVEDKPKPAVREAMAPKKEVKFTEDTKSGPEVKISQTARRMENIMGLSKRQSSGAPIIPVAESPEDAALRQEMLQYGMSEVGAVVAELDLEEGSDFDGDDDYDSEDMTSTDEEDEYGRSRSQVVDEEMRQQMIELEERLGVRMMENAGPGAKVGVVQEGIGRVSIKQQDLEPEAPANPNKEKTARKRGVKFAEELDIQGLPEPVQTVKSPVSKPHVLKRPPVSDIVERAVSIQDFAEETNARKKVSKFKALHTTQGPSAATFIPPLNFTEIPRTRIVPTGPHDKTLADGIVEHDVLDMEPLEPDEFDSALLHQEVAMEYHRMRNKMIQRQGGFMKNQEDEDGIIPFEEEEGGPKKVSRFKAARLARG